MNKVIIDQVRQVSAEMKAIRTRIEQEDRQVDKQEQGQYEQLHAERDELMGNIFFCAP